MSLKKRKDMLSNNLEMETKLLDAKTVLERNIRSVKNELVILNEASVKLSKETGEIRKRIAKNSDDLKERIDKYLTKIDENIEATYQLNIADIESHRQVLEEKVRSWNSDIGKCETALKKAKTNVDIVVSERKVLQMVLDSVDTSFVKPGLKLTRTAFLEKDAVFKDEKIGELVGDLDKRDENLEEIRHDLYEIASFGCPKYEINAIASDPEDRSVWTCMGSHLEIVNFDVSGDVNKTIVVDFKTDDIAMATDGSILTTSPDGHSVIKIAPRLPKIGEIVAKEIYNNGDYLHGINLSIDKTTVLLCATDKPNYSDSKPNVTSVIEVSLDGNFIRKVILRKYKGKVYRIAENNNGEYVITFPKEGCVLSVDRQGNIKSAFSKQTGNPNKVIDRGRMSTLKEFWPTGVCCNSKGRIFVTDWLGKRVICLDSTCKFVHYIGTDYHNPNAICVNLNLDTIWIGDKGRIHVWQT